MALEPDMAGLAAIEAEADRAAGQGNFAAAQARLAQVVEIAPDRIDTWLKLAATRRAGGNINGALAAVAGALRADPLHFMALLSRARLLEAMGDAPEAARNYAHALAQLPEGDAVPPGLAQAVAHARARVEAHRQDIAAVWDAAVEQDPALSDLERANLERFKSNALRRTQVYHSDPTHYHFPGLVEREFHRRADTPWLDRLERATPMILAELTALLEHETARAEPYISYAPGTPVRQWSRLNNSLDWTAFHLLQGGRIVEENAARCPGTMALLAGIDQPRIAGAVAQRDVFIAPPAHPDPAAHRHRQHPPGLPPAADRPRRLLVPRRRRTPRVACRRGLRLRRHHRARGRQRQCRTTHRLHPRPLAPRPDRRRARRRRPRHGGRGRQRVGVVVATRMTNPTFDRLLQAVRRPVPDRAAATELGLLAIDERREEDVLPLLAEIAGRTPLDATLLHVVGLMHRGVGDLSSAIEAFDRALSLGSGSARLVHARARAALEAGTDSLGWFERARKLVPNDGDVILGQAAALLAAGDDTAADSLLTNMLRQHPGWMPGHTTLIRLRFAGDGAGRALDELDTAIAGAPRDARLHDLKVMVLLRAGAGERALAAIAAARQALDSVQVLSAATAMVATELGSVAEADAAFTGLDPLADPTLALYWLRHLLRRQEPERVAAVAEALSLVMSEAARPYLSLAWRLTGDPRAAWLDDDRFVKIIDFGEDWPLLAPLAEALRPLHQAKRQPLDQSVRGGTQTDGPLFSRIDPTIRAARNRIFAEVASYIAGLPLPGTPHPFLARTPRRPRFAGSWSVRLTDGGFHEPHIHTEGWLSSAFYIAVPSSARGEAGALTLGQPQASLGLDLPPRRIIEARPGRLVLFPSTSWHGTRPFPSGERLTLAFDIA